MNAHNKWLGEVTEEDRQAIKRSLTVSSAGSVLLQTSISRVVQQLVHREHGVHSTLPRRRGSGNAFYSNRRTAANTGGAWVDDTTEPVTSEGGYTQVSFAYKTLLGRITVTRKLIAQGRSYGDVLATELDGKVDDLMDDLESASVIGDTNANANQIDGLLTLISNVSGQTVANTTAAGGDALVLSKLDETIDLVKGNATRMDLRIYGSRAGRRLLNNALQAQARYGNEGMQPITIDGQFVVESYGGIPMVTTTGMPDTLTWNGSVPRITVFSGSSTTALAVVNTRYVFYSELTPMTVEPLDNKSSQYDEVDIYNDITLVLDNTLGGAILGGLNPAA